MANNFPPTLEKKLINRHTPIHQTNKTFTKDHLKISFDSSKHRRMLVVEQGIHINGTLEDIETLVVAGKVETNSLKTKQVIIQRSGFFQGEIETQDIEITGTLEGNVVVQGNLIVTETGKLIGKAKCRRLKVEDGGQVTGQIEMITTEKLKPLTPLPNNNLLSDEEKNDNFLEHHLSL